VLPGRRPAVGAARRASGRPKAGHERQAVGISSQTPGAYAPLGVAILRASTGGKPLGGLLYAMRRQLHQTPGKGPRSVDNLLLTPLWGRPSGGFFHGCRDRRAVRDVNTTPHDGVGTLGPLCWHGAGRRVPGAGRRVQSAGCRVQSAECTSFPGSRRRRGPVVLGSDRASGCDRHASAAHSAPGSAPG